MSHKRVLITIFISIIGVCLHCFNVLFIAPKITNILGAEAYGFVSLATTFITYANIVTSALNAFAARYITIAYVKDNKEEFKKYYATVLWGNILISGIIFIVFLFITLNLEKFLNIPVQMIADVKILFILTFINFLTTSIGFVFSITGYIKGRQDLIQGIRCLSYLVNAILLIVLFCIVTPQIWYYGLATLLVGLFVLIGNITLTKIFLPEIDYSISNFSVSSFKKLVVNGAWNSFNSIGNVLNSGLDLIVSNLMLSAVGMGQIAIAKNFSSLSSTIVSSFSSAFHPSFLRAYSNGDKEELVNEFKYSMKLSTIPFNIIFSGFIVLGIPFLKLWIPSQDTQLIFSLVILAFIPSISEAPMYPLYYIYTLTVKNKIPCIVTICGGLINVLSMFLLLKYTNLGIYAVLITTAIIMSVINFVINPIYMCKCLKISLTTFYPLIIRNIISLIITIICFMICINFLPFASTWSMLILEIVIIGIIGLIIQCLTLFDLKNLKNLIRRFFVKNKKMKS